MIFDPYGPWNLIVWIIAALVLAGAVGSLVLDHRRGRNIRWVPASLRIVMVALACLALATAAQNPLVQREDSSGRHLAVVLDLSASLAPTDVGLAEVKQRAAAFLAGGLDDLFPADSSASLVLAGASPNNARPSLEPKDLEKVIVQISRKDLPPGGDTDLDAALKTAQENILKAGGRGSVLLVSDGHETTGNALAAARRLAARGIPVHVLTLPAKGENAPGIAAANLPETVEYGAETYLRAILVAEGKDARQMKITVSADGKSQTVTRQLSRTDGPGLLRAPLRFEKVGLRLAEIRIDDGSGTERRRRFLTHVMTPPRILIVGTGKDKTGYWGKFLPAGRFEVSYKEPVRLAGDPTFDPGAFDVIVIDAVPSQEIGEAALTKISAAVLSARTGLFIVNGPMRGTDESPTVLRSYDKTGIEPLLPVSSKPRPILKDPPGRHIVIMIDGSGSMSGWPLKKAKEMSRVIIEKLRPVDRLELIVFTTKPGHLVQNRLMDDAGKQFALDQLNNIVAGGGTDPTEALALISGRRFSNCGLFFFSDGFFNTVTLRPDCKPTVFAIGATESSITAALRAIADPIPVGTKFDAASIKLEFFEPQPRDRLFEPGAYTPVNGIDAMMEGWSLLPLNPPPLSGNAVTYAKVGAVVASIRPRLLDPVLAFQDTRGASVGVFTTSFPGPWIARPDTAETVTAWIRRIVPFEAHDRYSLSFKDLGDAMTVRLALAAEEGRVPEIDRVLIQVRISGGAPIDFNLRPDPENPDSFIGAFRLPNSAAPVDAVMVIRETGRGALRRTQLLPIVLPPAALVTAKPGAEHWSRGVNTGKLRAIAGAGGGVFNPAHPAILAAAPLAAGVGLWPWFTAIAVLFYLLAIMLRRMFA